MTAPVSVIIPTYNRGEFLRRGINSALEACAENDEIIVVDDGSTDQTKALVNSFSDPRLSYVYQDNSGVATARNLGMERASNDLIAFLDDDDEWHPAKLAVQIALLAEHPEAVASFSNFWITDRLGNRTNNYLLRWGQPLQDWNQMLGTTRTFRLDGTGKEFDYYLGEHYFNQMQDDYILPSSLIIDRSRFQNPLRFLDGFERMESWLFSSQVCRQGPVIYVDYDLACQHGDADNRLTAIPIVDTVLSRLYVLENEFGKRTDFTEEQQRALAQRLSKEAHVLFVSSMRTKTPNRRQIFQANKHHGGKIAIAAKLPDWMLSLLSVFIRTVKGGWGK
jgi:glycosyltransferase involved in cell wall biosynthesis